MLYEQWLPFLVIITTGGVAAYLILIALK